MFGASVLWSFRVGRVRARSSAWRSTSIFRSTASNAWNVNFNNGNVNNNDKTNTNYVRCVRRGTWKPERSAGRAGER